MSKIKELECIIDAMRNCSDEIRYNDLFAIAKSLLSKVSIGDQPRLLWLKTQLPNFGETDFIGNTDNYLLHSLERSSTEGCIEAQYDYGCLLYESGRKEEAYFLYEKSALQGYAPSQWVWGSHLINFDFEKGKFFIILSAGQNYEYAIDFLIYSYENNKNGFMEDKAELEKWKFIKSYLH